MRTFGLSLILLMLVTGTVWWVSSDTSAPATPVAAHDQIVDYYLRGVKITTLDANGQPERSLQTAEIRHFAGNTGTQLQQPALTLYPADEPPWRMVANSGWLDASGDTLSLSGAIQLSRAASATTAPIQLQTETLQIQLPRRYLETAQPVQINSGSQQLRAVGMRAWLQAPLKLEFLHEVEGTYVPADS
ncbi:MAG: LPS export ABC transporter periplasmic protein LptC [Pseudomonadota bacterium]